MHNVAETTSTVEFDTTLRSLERAARKVYPAEHGRLMRGLVLALNGHVTLHADGSASVKSGSDAEIVYHVNGHCDCPDASRAPESRCKHRWAKCLVKRAQQAGAYYTSTTDAQGLVLGGHKATADAKRAEEEAAGGLAYLICHHDGARHN